MERKTITFIKAHGAYRRNDVAGFEATKADKLIATGVAVPYNAEGAKPQRPHVDTDQTRADASEAATLRAENDALRAELAAASAGDGTGGDPEPGTGGGDEKSDPGKPPKQAAK